MERLVNSMGKNPRPVSTRSQWKRSLVEINGKLRRDHIHDMYPLVMKSYSQIGLFPHVYYNGDPPCIFHTGEFNYFTYQNESQVRDALELLAMRWMGIAGLEFNSKGIYLASATRAGCLTVHDFESLYNAGDGDGKQLLHIALSDGISAVRWNPAKQDEVACTSSCTNEVHIFDIGNIDSKPTEVLRKTPATGVSGSSVRQGLFDIALFNDGSRVLASDKYGTINIWDRRVSDLPQNELTTNSISDLTSIQLKGDQCVYGASKYGFIYTWDLRCGKSSYIEKHSPQTSANLAYLLNKIVPLTAQSNIIPKQIHSININPSCPNQLGFHLLGDWSGVLDLHNSQVSHIHCAPSTWGGPNELLPILFKMKPCWIPEHSIYAVGTTSSQGLHLLDFYPNNSSPCHVDYDNSKSSKETIQKKENGFVPLSECVTACATHPLTGTIVAGTMELSLLTISQKNRSYKEDDDEEEEEELNIHDGFESVLQLWRES